ncbi:MAG: hypothetical protein AMXMBFR23_19440 [Chloroflexota bacterium]
MIDGGLELDLEAVRQNVVEAEVVCFYFTVLGRTLVVDTRHNDQVGTFIRVVPMAKDSGERLRSIRRLRPQLPRPTSITLIPWDCRVASLVSLGVWEPLLARLDNIEEAQACLEALCQRERRELRRIIRGHQYDTLWMRPDYTREGAEQ